MLARQTRMIAAVLGTAILVAGIAPAALAGRPAASHATTPALSTAQPEPSPDATPVAAAIGTEYAVKYARFYPRKDGYRDTDMISGTTLVPATVTSRIYTSGGTRIKSFLLGAQEGAYSAVWNGRRKDGSLFPQGTYTVRQFLTAEGSTDTATHTVVLSHKKVTWYLGSQTRYADTGAFFTAENGDVRPASLFTRGIELFGGSVEGVSHASARYVFTLPTAHVYASLRLSVYGKSVFGPGDHEAFGEGHIGIYNFDTLETDGETKIGFPTAWYETSIPAPGHVTPERKVQTWAYAEYGEYSIIQKVKLTYKYGILGY